MTDKTFKAYSSYYDSMETGIGGEARFQWIMEELLKDSGNKSILEVGCGEGSLLKILKQGGSKVFGIDASESGVRGCREKGIDCALVDISRDIFPHKDSEFDVVACLETLEHLENPYHCLTEIKRVLKEGGLFIASIPNPKILHPYVYPGLFELRNFKEFLGLNSFEIVKIKGWGQAIMLNKIYRQFKSRNSFLAGFVYFLGRKRNLVMRKYLGTPLAHCHSYNFACVNHKTSKTLLEKVAEDTTP